MEVKNFALFTLWLGNECIGTGRMEELMPLAQQHAEKNQGKSVEICFMEFDGDLDDDNSKLQKGQVILQYHLLFEGKMIVCSGK